jgi:hypothetical protein
LFLNFAFDNAFSKVQLNRRRLKLNGKQHLLVCADDSIFWVKRKITTINKNTKALLVANEEVGLEVNAEQKAGKIRQLEPQYKKIYLW